MNVLRAETECPESITVFHDGGCPVCAREIDHYRALAAKAPIRWVDANSDAKALAEAGLSRAQALRQLHARTATGTWLVGVAAFVAIWQRIPRYRWLAGLLLGLHLVQPLQHAYRWWAMRRFRRLCAAGRCQRAPSHAQPSSRSSR